MVSETLVASKRCVGAGIDRAANSPDGLRIASDTEQKLTWGNAAKFYGVA